MADNNTHGNEKVDLDAILDTHEGKVASLDITVQRLGDLHRLEEIVKYGRRKASLVRNRLFDPTRDHTDVELATMAVKAARGEI